MRFFFLIALLILVVALIFAVQNTAAATISFLIWQREISLALALLVAFLFGCAVVGLALLPGWFSNRFKASSQGRRMRELEAELEARSAGNIEGGPPASRENPNEEG
jgi:putative membrane protein